jgi:hypothetical protein
MQGREWRIEELILVRHAPLERVQHAVRDMRAVLKSDERVLKALHRRVFLNRITPDGYELIISCYVEAANRDQFMAVKEDLLQVLVQILGRYQIRLASNNRLLEILPGVMGEGGAAAAGGAMAAAAAAAIAAAAASAAGGESLSSGKGGGGKGDKGDKGDSGKADKPKPPFSFGW